MLTNSQTNGQGKSLVGITNMQKAFTNYVNGLANESFGQADRVVEIQHLNGCIHVVAKELQEWLDIVKDTTKEKYKWIIRYTTIYMGRLEGIIPIMVAANAHKVRMDKGKRK